MAKKARRKLEDEDAADDFEFPEFDDQAFIRHEFEQTYALAFALLVAIGLAVVSISIDLLLSGHSEQTLEGLLPLALSIAVITFSPFILQRLRAAANDYTRADWAGVILLEIFGWLGIWFLLSNVFAPT